ncbi:hypothetical protein CIHG_00689 [Coccidioides immitis H538.4]|uniref:Uncharacterized protein n=1 Tax=Coccidioides immitis H538.4 TaxID=396776 RepID=A0A0J8RDB3_COCIT|nr:hypothetical protein CIHG_00689 [Coccidioides immitis H538.4]
MSFICPVSALQEDVTHGLRPIAALALVGVGLVDGVKIFENRSRGLCASRPQAKGTPGQKGSGLNPRRHTQEDIPLTETTLIGNHGFPRGHSADGDHFNQESWLPSGHNCQSCCNWCRLTVISGLMILCALSEISQRVQ